MPGFASAVFQLRQDGASRHGRLKQLRGAPNDQGDNARNKYAESYKFTDRMSGWRKVQAVIRKIEGARMRLRSDFRVAPSANVHVSHVSSPAYQAYAERSSHQESPFPIALQPMIDSQ
jgi:hypothetical protein